MASKKKNDQYVELAVLLGSAVVGGVAGKMANSLPTKLGMEAVDTKIISGAKMVAGIAVNLVPTKDKMLQNALIGFGTGMVAQAGGELFNEFTGVGNPWSDRVGATPNRNVAGLKRKAVVGRGQYDNQAYAVGATDTRKLNALARQKPSQKREGSTMSIGQPKNKSYAF